MSSRKRVPPQADFGRALQQLRAARGLVQEDMLLATSRRHISRIEQGHQVPSIRTIEVLAEQMQIHPLAVGLCVRQWQPSRIVDAGFSTEGAQQSRSLFGQQSAIGALSHRAVEQQDAGCMGRTLCGHESLKIGLLEERGINVGKIRIHTSPLKSSRP